MRGEGEKTMCLEITSATRTEWKWRHCGHFVVSLVPDILSGRTCSLHVLECQSGHGSSRLGRRKMSNFKPHYQSPYLFMRLALAWYVLLPTLAYLQWVWRTDDPRLRLSWEEKKPHFLVDTLIAWIIERVCKKKKQVKCNMWPCYWLPPFVTFQL